MEKIKNYFHTTFSSLKVRNYRLYFIGQAISFSGTWMQTVGQAWLVLKLTNSGTQLGLVSAAQYLPVLFFGPWGGVITDRFPKRKLLYLTQSIFAILALILGILVATGTVQLWMIYLLALGFGLTSAVDNTARQTFIFEMVGKEHLTNAITLNSSQFNMSRVIGPAIAGGVIAVFGLAPCFIFNAVSFIAVLIALFMMRGRELFAAPPINRAKGQLREGFKYILSSPVLKNTLLMIAIIGTLSYEFSVSLPLLARFTFHGSAGAYAALTSAMGLGAVIGGLYTANQKKTGSSMLILAAFLLGLSMMLCAVAPSLILAMFGIVIIGALSINYTSRSNVILQLKSEPSMRGRVMSLYTVAFIGSTPIGGPIIGWIGQYAGPRWSLGLGGLAAVIAAGLGWLILRKQKLMSQSFAN